MWKPRFCAIVLFCVVLPGSDLAGQTAPASLAEEIPRLIKVLGSSRWAKREAATKRLIEIGIAALPAVRKAIGDPDLEVSVRAMHICRQLTQVDPKEVAARRLEVQSAFLRGAYQEMAERGEALVAKHGDVLDLLWLGHAHQLAGNWPKAADGYRKLADRLGDELKELAKDPPPRDPAVDVPLLSKTERAALSANLRRQRAGLMWLVARLQQHELKDSKAASATLVKADAQIANAPPDTPLGRFRFVLLRQLAECQEAGGLRKEATATWARIYEYGMKCRHWPASHESGFDVAAVIRLVAAMPADKPVPLTPGLIVLSPDKPKVTLRLNEEKTWLLSYSPLGRNLGKFAFSPPPGMEFTSIQFDADLEQRATTGPRAHIYCKALPRGRAEPAFVFSGLTWPDAEQTGRKTVTRTFNVPAGAGAILISMAMKSHATHGITIEAKLAPQRKAGPAFAAKPVLRTELLPAGGTLTCDGRKISVESNVIHTRLGTGKHVLTYQAPDRKGSLTYALNMVAGGTYGLFLNHDSPFRSGSTDLRGIGSVSWWMACTNSLARLPDGRWLLAGSGRDEKIRLVESKNLVDWGPPRPLPLNSAFRNHAARLFVDDKGLIWLAWFSDRLQVETASWHSRYRLWLSSSREGRTWSLPRPIGMDPTGEDWPPDPVSIVRGPKGKIWIYWRNLAGHADSLGGISTLDPIDMPGSWSRMRNTHVAVDAAGTRHMLCDRKLGIAYSRSDDGQTWTRPVTLVQKPRGGHAWRGQLVIGKDGACMIYERDKGARMCSVALGEAAVLGTTVKITGEQTPLNAMRLCWTKDGRAVFLAGADTACLLQAKADDFFRASAPGPPEKPHLPHGSE